MRRAFGTARLLLALLGLVALIGYFIVILGVSGFAIGSYFSYFTVQSTMAAVCVFFVAGLIALRRPTDPAWLDTLRVMATTYILVSGVVYAIIVLQAANVNYDIEVPWSSQVLHFWIPAMALVDWFVDPNKARLPWRYLAWVLVFPSFWLVFTLIRGNLVGWYPYFFLDSRQVNGPGETMFYCAIVMVIILGIAALLTSATRLRRRPFDDTGRRPFQHRLPVELTRHAPAAPEPEPVASVLTGAAAPPG
ncbi:MAG: Pr6Pr family membrane protein [Cryobacterium sp.]